MRRFLLLSLVLAFAYSLAGSRAGAQDTTPPTLVSATRYTTNYNLVLLQLSERPDTNSAQVFSNYKIYNARTPAEELDVIGVQTFRTPTASTSNIVLTTSSALDLNKDWILEVSNVTDTNGNAIVEGSKILITTVEDILPDGSEWYYADQGRYESVHRFYDKSWIEKSFYENNFGAGAAPFHRGAGLQGVGTPTCCFETGDVNVFSKAYYFASEFQLTGALYRGDFRMRLRFADGFIMYLNGVEVLRTNMPTTTNVTYDTLASRANGNTAFSSQLAFTPTMLDNLRPGTNYIAVEVHRNNTESGAFIWDMEILHTYTNRLTGSIVILQQPQTVTVTEGQPATFSVENEGAPPYKYAWSVGGTAVNPTTNPTADDRVFTIPAAALADNGKDVTVRITGGTGAGTATSTAAKLNVVADTNAPTLVSAVMGAGDASGNTTTVTLTFSEKMENASAVNKANYVITNATGAAVAVNSVAASGTDGKVFVLTTATLKVSDQYTLKISGLKDGSSKLNAMPTTLATLGANYALIPWNAVWKFYEKGTNPVVGATWNTKGYNDNSWTSGAGILANTVFNDPSYPAPINNILLLNDDNGNDLITTYFRKSFTLGSTQGVTLTLSHVVDDGMVVWLNGQVAYRYNMPASPATPLFTTRASSRIESDPLPIVTDITIPVTNLTSGANILAVELHQASGALLDSAFGLELEASVRSTISTNVTPANAAPTVTITSPAANATFVAPANVTINATATDSDGTVAKVEFFNGDTKLGEDASSPYSFVANGLAAGNYTLRAIATDNKGLASAPATVAIVVNANVAPTVTITSPAANATFAAPANVTINATATDSDGTVAKVEFFNGNTKLGEDASSPYSFVANGLAAGNYTLRAIATDDKGLASTAATVNIVVTGVEPAPVLAVARNGNNLVFTWVGAGYTLQSTTSLSAPNWTAVPSGPHTSGLSIAAPAVPTFYRLNK